MSIDAVNGSHLIGYLLKLRSNPTWVCGEFYSRGSIIPGDGKPVTGSLALPSENK